MKGLRSAYLLTIKEIYLILDQLDPKFTYHCKEHSIKVYKACLRAINRNKWSLKDSYCLRIAALGHDIGFVKGFKNHEEVGSELIKSIMSKHGFSKRDLEKTSKLILASDPTIKPKNLFQKILKDSDLDYLGNGSYTKWSNLLKKELLAIGLINKRTNWLKFQLEFLKSHRYYTDYAIKNREPEKQRIIKILERKSK